MRAPPIGNRVVLGGVAAVALVLVLACTFVFVTVSNEFDALISDTLDTRVEVARKLGEMVDSEEELAQQLADHGIPAVVRDASGNAANVRLAADTDELPALLLDDGGAVPSDYATSMIRYSNGTTALVFASRAGINSIERQLFLVLTIAAVAGVALAWLTLHGASRIALSPLHEMADTLRRTRAGKLDERLDPSRTDTEVGELALAFDEMLDALESSMAEVEVADQRNRRFLADSAYQLRMPISAILAAVESLLRTDDEDDREGLYRTLLNESIRSGYVIAKLLHMARLDHGTIDEQASADVVQLVADEVTRTSELAPHLDITFVPAMSRLDMLVDGELVREAVVNILVNARRHARTKITVSLNVVHNFAEIAIDDDGDGLAEDLVDLAFERFTTLDGKGGSGLGLPIARQIARAHGGDVVYRNKKFIVLLPLHATAETPLALK